MRTTQLAALVLALTACVSTEPSKSSSRTTIASAQTAFGSRVVTTESDDFEARMRSAVGTSVPAAVDRVVRLFPDRALHAFRACAHGNREVDCDSLAASLERVFGIDASVWSAYETARSEAERALLDDDKPGALSAATRALDVAHADSCTVLVLEGGLATARIAGASGDAARAASAWRDAVTAAHEAHDARLVRIALDTRPKDADVRDAGWPSEAALTLAVAEWEHAREELSLALLDASRSCSLSDDASRGRAELVRARVLAALGRRGEAVDAASRLTSDSKADVANAAWALMGSIAGEVGELDRARECLEKAVNDGREWSGRGRALADLGVVEFSANRLPEAERALVAAVPALESNADRAGLARTLRLLATVQARLGETALAQETTQRSVDAERAAGLIPSR